MKTLRPRPGVLAAHLRRQPLFEAATDVDRERIARCASLRLYDRDERLFQQGERALTLHCLVHGAVRVHKPGPGGREKVLHLLRAPGLVAEVPVMMRRPFPATATCSEPCTVVSIPRNDLLLLAQRDQEFTLRVLAAAMTRLQQLTRSLAEHGERSAVLRVASYLLGACSDTDQLDLPAAKKDIANYLGLQPETFSRALARLRSEQAIAVEEQRIRILDRPRLVAFLGTDGGH